jgi:hypothetical protein
MNFKDLKEEMTFFVSAKEPQLRNCDKYATVHSSISEHSTLNTLFVLNKSGISIIK